MRCNLNDCEGVGRVEGTDGVWGAVLIIRGWGRVAWRQPECPRIYQGVPGCPRIYYQGAPVYTKVYYGAPPIYTRCTKVTNIHTRVVHVYTKVNQGATKYSLKDLGILPQFIQSSDLKVEQHPKKF